MTKHKAQMLERPPTQALVRLEIIYVDYYYMKELHACKYVRIIYNLYLSELNPLSFISQAGMTERSPMIFAYTLEQTEGFKVSVKKRNNWHFDMEFLQRRCSTNYEKVLKSFNLDF